MISKKCFCLSLSIFLAGCSNSTVKKTDIQYQSLESKKQVRYSNENVKNNFVDASLDVSLKQLKKNQNSLTSPLTIGMNYDSIALVSSNADNILNQFGILSLDEYESFAKAFNWTEEDNSIRSVTFHQIAQDNNQLEFKEDMRSKLTSHGIATIDSSTVNAKKDADDFISKALGKQLELPDVFFMDYAAMTYTALTVKATCNYCETERAFTNTAKMTKTVKGILETSNYKYQKGANYQAIEFPVNRMELTFILPDSDVSLDDINVKNAFLDTKKNGKEEAIEAFLPFFELSSELDFTDDFAATFKEAKVYDKLLEDTTPLKVPFCKQKNKIVFNEHGLEGDSVTIGGLGGSSEPVTPTKTFYVDRPFCFVCSYEDIPMFVGTIADL